MQIIDKILEFLGFMLNPKLYSRKQLARAVMDDYKRKMKRKIK
jgi:hypothetical protein